MSSRRRHKKKQRLMEDIKRIQETEALVDLGLLKSPGSADTMTRFVRCYSRKIGDYTKERKSWVEKDFETVAAGILEHRKKKNSD